MHIIFFMVCFLASIIGSICGIGGGVIIKPVLDSFHVMDVAAVSFLSGCTVLSMTTYSVLKGKFSHESHIDSRRGMPLALGAAIGGLAGKELFSIVSALSSDKNKVGAVQAICLLIVTFGTLIYTINKQRIKTYHVKNRIICAVIGFFLGLMSAFLGIGGGPINLVVLYFFFSMSTKVAAENSLYIIFFSQITSLISTFITNKVPEYELPILVLMIIGGIGGGICGRFYNRKLKEATVDKLFIWLMILMIVINIYNIFLFM